MDSLLNKMCLNKRKFEEKVTVLEKIILDANLEVHNDPKIDNLLDKSKTFEAHRDFSLKAVEEIPEVNLTYYCAIKGVLITVF